MTTVKQECLYRIFAALLLCLLGGCGPATVVVQGQFPPPLIEPLPLTLGVWYGDDFAKHEIFDEAKSKQESSWLVSTGAAQMQMWDTLLGGMFTKVERLRNPPGPGQSNPGLAAVLIPHVDELQYTIPTQTNVKVYEIWMRYRFELVTPDGTPIAQWTMPSYGKTPTAILQSDQEAVNLAAVMALRDAGANFATHFTHVPGVEAWLRERGALPEAANAAASLPEASEPEASRPEAAEPDAPLPETPEPNASSPEAPDSGAPLPETPTQ